MSLTLTLARGGGEVSGSGTNIELDGTIAGGAIESVEMYGDTEQQTYSGKNLLPFPGVSSIQNGIVFTPNADGSVTLNGKNNNNGNSAYYFVNFGATGVSMTMPAGTYTVSGITGSQTITFYDGTNYYDRSAASPSMTFNSSKTFTSVYLQVRKGDTTQYDNYKVYLMLEAGSTATAYEPYVGGTASPNPDYPQEVQTVTGRQVVTISDGGSQSQEYEINLGKNLFDVTDLTAITISSNNATLNTTSEKITITTTNSANSGFFITNANLNSHIYSRNDDTIYTVSMKIKANRSIPFTIGCDTRTSVTVGTTEARYSVQTKISQYALACWSTAATANDTIEVSELQIEKGTSATDYAPYFTPIELCKIGTYQDYIYKSGNDWYVRKNTDTVVLKGSEDWQSSSAATGYYRARVDMSTNNATVGGYCNEFTNRGSGSHGAYEYVWFQPAAAPVYIQLSTARANTLETFKTWLGTHNATVYRTLATPTDTQITDAALIAQLEALNAGDTYDGTTLITVSSENLAGSLEVTVSSNITKTYTEVEIGSPFTITDVEGKSSNTTLDGNVYVDWAYNKKQYSFDLFNLTPQDYADIRAFYDYQFNNSAFPTITVPELNIDKLPVYMEISSRNIINQCLLTDKLTIKFRETVQP